MNPICMLVLLGAGFLPVLLWAGAPTEQLHQTTDQILAIVQDPAFQGPGQAAERQRQMRKVIDTRFDWASMARSAYGKNWMQLSETQRQEFTSLFGELVNKTYMAKVEGYAGEKIIYKGDKVDGQYGVVDVVIVTARGTDIPVSYRVLQQGTRWQVYDVVIEGVSLVNNYRSQIAAIRANSSYAELVARLRNKIAAAPTGNSEKHTGDAPDAKNVEGGL